MATRVGDSDAGSMTPSEPSDADDRSERDSDYESDEEEEHKEQLNLQWTGYGKKTPVILFCPSAMLQKKSAKRTVGERYHLTYKFGNSECKVVRNIFNYHGFHEVHPNSSDFSIIWTGGHLKPFTLRSMTEFQKINHFPRSYEITRKDRLFKNVQRMQQIKGAKHFDFIPSSFILPSEYQDFCAAFLKEKGVWIVKPVASSRGRGVFLCNHPDQVPLDENLIVCKYVHNPLLIDGFKFDVRLYVCVTSYDPLNIYLFEEGLTRFATVKYEKGNRYIRNQCMHLTNYSVNKKSDDYVKNDDPDVEDYGNKWSLGALLRYLRSHGKDIAGLMMRIEDVIIKTILSVELPVATACKMFMPFRGNCFELYGFDILIDDNLKPWILEVNLSPSLACDSPLDLKIKTNMICDLFSLSGIVCHDPMMRTLQQSRRNQEVTAKIAARAKSARYRPSSASSVRQRPQSANSAASSAAGNTNKNSNSPMAGLNSEEIKILRRVKEEDQRKGGWVRIFPTPDSWDLYSSFLQFSTTHNLMLHSRLYPERHKGSNPPPKGVASTSMGQRARSAYANVGGSSTKSDHEYAECYAQAILRTKQYERKLGTARHRRRRNQNRNKRKEKVRPKLVQGVVEEAEDEDKEDAEQSDDNDNNEEDNVNVRGGDSGSSSSEPVDNGKTEKNIIEVEKSSKSSEPVPPSSSSSSSSSTQVTNSQPPAEKEQNIEKLPPKPPTLTTNKKQETKPVQVRDEEETVEKPPPPVEIPPPPPKEPRYNVVAMLQKGQTLSKCQARSAFAMYLIRVQQRLISETSPSNQDDSDALNEQMDLVLRFLKRAAVNLQQPFKVVVPSRKLPLNDRRRILAKQLGDFVHIYNKETEHLHSKQQQDKRQGKIAEVHPGASQSENVCENKFDKFVNTASEGDLEEVLTTYTKINKSASIFLGGNPKHSNSDTTQSRPGSNSSTQARPVVVAVKEPRTSTILPNRQSASHPSTILQNRPGSAMSSQSAALANSESSLLKRQDSEISIIEVQAQKANGWEDLPKSVSSTTAATASRPSTASLNGDPHTRVYHTPSQSSYANAVQVYTQKLTTNRPRSASTGGQRTAMVKPGLNRPMSATGRTSSYNPYATTDPTVDSYNDQAIHDALQRLALRQQARQYSAHSGTSVMGDDRSRPSSAKGGHGTSDAPHYVRSNSAVDNLTYVIGHGSNGANYVPNQNPDYNSEIVYRVPSNSGLKSESDRIQTNSSVFSSEQSKVQRSLSATDSVKYNTNGVITEDYSRSRPPSGQGQRQTEVRSAQGSRRPIQSNVNLQNANATFNSFIEDSKGGHWHNDLALAYNQVTGVLPNNYHTPSQSSKQYQLMQQQALKQESKALLEQSKAKHQAMVAQAHAVQKSIQQQKRPPSREVESAVQKYAPKPPIQPSYTRKAPGPHRVQSSLQWSNASKIDMMESRKPLIDPVLESIQLNGSPFIGGNAATTGGNSGPVLQTVMTVVDIPVEA